MANLRDVARAVEQRGARKLARGTVDLALPVYAGEYAARFGVLSGEALAQFESLTMRADVSADESLEFSADFLADACRMILGRGAPGAAYEPLTHDDGRPVRFDEDFATALALSPPEGRELDSMAAVVRAVWTTDAGEVNAAALNSYAIRLLTWMQNTSQEVEGELVGESRGTRP